MSCLTDLARDAKVGSDEPLGGDAQMVERLTGREIEDPIERHVVSVQHARKQAGNADHLSLSEVA